MKILILKSTSKIWSYWLTLKTSMGFLFLQHPIQMKFSTKSQCSLLQTIEFQIDPSYDTTLEWNCLGGHGFFLAAEFQLPRNILFSLRCLITAKEIQFYSGFCKQPRKFIITRQGRLPFPWRFLLNRHGKCAYIFLLVLYYIIIISSYFSFIKMKYALDIVRIIWH